ncbi:MAG: putative Ig [Caulobacter sp.]|nr:putative Ig [Caulobacter sp.]
MPTYTGTSGNDSITGSAGDDTIDGLAGADTMTGGTGNDLYIVDNVFDSVVEGVGEGTDTVEASVNYVLAANVENLTLTGTAVSGSGNALENVIHGNASDNILFGDNDRDSLYGEGGNDTLYGGSDNENDLLDGGTGDDIMYGGLGNDVYYVDSLSDAAVEAASEGFDIVRTYLDWTLGANLEAIQIQGSSNLNATGNSAANQLTGNSGDNTLSGAAGVDTIHGGSGNDLIIGGLTGDHLYGDAGYDTFAFFDESVNLATVEQDRIYDLDMANGDRIDVSAIDADTGTGGDQAFTFVGSFTNVAGQATATYVTGPAPYTDFNFDVDGDGTSDYRIRVEGNHTGTTSDILTGGEPISDGGWLL